MPGAVTQRASRNEEPQPKQGSCAGIGYTGRAVITLALDTSTPYLTLGLSWPSGDLGHAPHLERAHAERLPAEVQALFSEAGLPLRADRIVIGTGPGSYTGVRVGASYALALARVWQAELLGVSTLTALLPTDGSADGTYLPALDARRDHVYAGVYQVTKGNVEELTAPTKLPAADLDALATEHQASIRQDVQPSGLSLIRAAQSLGQPQPELALSYL